MGKNLNAKIWLFTILIMGMGLISLYSASFFSARVSHDVFYDQLYCALLGLGLMYLLSRIDYRRFYDLSYLFFVLNIFLLLFVYFGGRHALGARRWIEIGGLSFQPSELTKLAVIFFLGRYLSSRRPKLSFDFLSRAQLLFQDFLLPFILVVIPMYLIFKQPDLGTAILIMGIFIVMIFVSGIEAKVLLSFLGLCLVSMPFVWHLLKPYQKDRLLVFLDPNTDPLGAGYTIIQSKISIGSGQIFGKGWLSGTQNQLNFLPERHTDFIFSVVGEEWGLMGTLFVLFCFAGIIYAGFKVAEQDKDRFGMLVAVGIVTILSLQVIINIGMVMGLFPVVGITLPFMSYGRTSFLVFVIMMGFLLSLNQHRRIF